MKCIIQPACHFLTVSCRANCVSLVPHLPVSVLPHCEAFSLTSCLIFLFFHSLFLAYKYWFFFSFSLFSLSAIFYLLCSFKSSIFIHKPTCRLLTLFLTTTKLFFFLLPWYPLFFHLLTSSALRSCSTGDSLLSSAFIRSAKSAPTLAPPLPVLHHHHPFLPPLADNLAGTLCSACRLETVTSCMPVRNLNDAFCLVFSSF